MPKRFIVLHYLFILITLVCCQTGKDTFQVKKLEEIVTPLYDPALKPFYHGVASGDPLTDRVVIWTRITPEDSIPKIPVAWEVSETEDFTSIVKSDSTTTSPEKDYTVKVDVAGLAPGKKYYYRFTALNNTSPIGKTKTLSDDESDSIKLAVVSCSNWEFGYFNAYDRIAEKEIDAVLHLGDYIYEYEQGKYGNDAIDRKHLPAHEAVTLQDYRTRYSQYHLDASLRNIRQQCAFITIWDDHEVANDTYASGAGNHQSDKEGEFLARRNAARQAYYEWIPIRENNELYRAFSFGNIADVIMLDERLAGRMKQADSLSDPRLQEPERSMLGKEQLKWFEDGLKNSRAAWRVIGNQVIFSDLDQSAVSPKNPRNLDSWDGYPAEKNKIASFIRDNRINDVIFLAGDTHASWAFEVIVNPLQKLDGKKNSQKPLAIEFGTTSISSGNWNEQLPDDSVKIREEKLLRSNPHLKYLNHRDHGYLLLTLYPQKAKAEWFYIETIREIKAGEHLGKTLEVAKGTTSLR